MPYWDLSRFLSTPLRNLHPSSSFPLSPIYDSFAHNFFPFSRPLFCLLRVLLLLIFFFSLSPPLFRSLCVPLYLVQYYFISYAASSSGGNHGLFLLLPFPLLDFPILLLTTATIFRTIFLLMKLTSSFCFQTRGSSVDNLSLGSSMY